MSSEFFVDGISLGYWYNATGYSTLLFLVSSLVAYSVWAYYFLKHQSDSHDPFAEANARTAEIMDEYVAWGETNGELASCWGHMKRDQSYFGRVEETGAGWVLYLTKPPDGKEQLTEVPPQENLIELLYVAEEKYGYCLYGWASNHSRTLSDAKSKVWELSYERRAEAKRAAKAEALRESMRRLPGI